jgi:uncharacterized membrane protein
MLKEKKDANLLTDVNVQKDLVKEAERLEIKDKATLVLTELLLTKDNILADIKQYRMLFLRFCHQNPKAQTLMEVDGRKQRSKTPMEVSDKVHANSQER